ncbi:IclR family transcriptional regulator C-terminal domain-containing protein [Pedobacter sp. Du54]|uniref:IclR family transcriptional regulator n=1 Tax=Pedobacter anseongensis TaxID=3133439 RepID=UPI0030AFD10D
MIQVLNRAIDILEYVAENGDEPKLMGKIAKDSNLNLGTCSNIVKTLVERRVLKKAEHEKGYIIGDLISEVNNGSLGYKALMIQAIPVLNKVTNEINENSLVAILKNDKRQVIVNKFSNHLIQATTPEEKMAYDSSTGRLLIAFLPDRDIQFYLKKHGLPPKEVWQKAASRIGFFDQIELIRNQKFALIEDSVQVVGIAVPIYKNNKVIASFSIYLPSFRFNQEVKSKMIEFAIEAGKLLSS